jgi:hypothetical protein
MLGFGQVNPFHSNLLTQMVQIVIFFAEKYFSETHSFANNHGKV